MNSSEFYCEQILRLAVIILQNLQLIYTVKNLLHVLTNTVLDLVS